MFEISKYQYSGISGGAGRWSMTEAAGVVGGLGGGVAASSIISDAGGLKNVAATMRLPVGTAAGLGLLSAFFAGYAVGGGIYSIDAVALTIGDGLDWLMSE